MPQSPERGPAARARASAPAVLKARVGDDKPLRDAVKKELDSDDEARAQAKPPSEKDGHEEEEQEEEHEEEEEAESPDPAPGVANDARKLDGIG